MKPRGSSAVMSARQSPRKPAAERTGKRAKKVATPAPADLRPRDPREGLDFFPTPPWATRALPEWVLPGGATAMRGRSVWEPCCGEGHQAEVLAEYFGRVHASDVYPHGYGAVGSFIGNAGLDLDIARCPFAPDWIITNPPYSLAVEVVERALAEAREGVAVLVRTLWIESDDRYQLFCRHEPWMVATFAERVPMVQYRWDPEASTATSYSWIVWLKTGGVFARPRGPAPSYNGMLIPPVCRATLTREDDVRRFTRVADAPLLEGVV